MALVKYRTPFNTLFNDFFNDVEESNYAVTFQPQINLTENKEGYNITLAVPGFKKEDIKLEVNDNNLVITGEYKYEKNEDEKHHRTEIKYGKFERAFRLPENINIDKIDAKHEDGLLKVTLKKEEQLERKKIIKIK